jgi:uncharacterized protein YnzC (UPF0291/DUF896 family)
VRDKRVRTVNEERQSNERYISDFEKKIKLQLSKIHVIEGYGSGLSDNEEE